MAFGVEAVLAAFQAGKTVSQILNLARSAAKGAPLDPEALAAILDMVRSGPLATQAIMRRAAVPRWFDRDDYTRKLALEKSAPSFASFTRRTEVAPVERTGCFCIAETARDAALREWDPAALKQFAGEMVKYYGGRKDAMNKFVCLLFADPNAALTEFHRRYRVLDKVFDYVALDDLLCVVRDRQKHISPALVAALNDREQYYQSRALYAEDWVKSEQFLERPVLLNAFERFFNNRQSFLMHLHARGGAGKTAFLRWLISRRAVVERGPQDARIPVARVDIDQVNMAAVRRWPWLLLVPLIRHLNLQLPGAPFESILGLAGPMEPLVRRGYSGELYYSADSMELTLKPLLYTSLAAGIGQSKCLVIFDTIEELMLHLPDKFNVLIEELATIRESCPGFRVLISGRYPLNEVKVCAEVVAKLPAGRFQAVLVPPFTAPESRRYLTRIRGLDDAALVRKIVLHSGIGKPNPKQPQCNPFKLSLFADLALTPPGLKDDDFRRPEVSYLLRRIIERIPEDELALRWTLRYAVIPRQLTPEFFDNVLKPHLEREIAQQSGQSDNPSKGLPRGYKNPWKYVKNGSVQREELWTALRKYAGPRSWARLSGDIPQLQPEVVQPMRWLLRQSGMFSQLHTGAIVYFEGLAQSCGAEWATWMTEVLYHRFQRDGAAAGAYWARLLEKDRHARDPEARQQICELLVSGDFVDDLHNPLADPKTGALLVDLPTLASARLELASIFTQQALAAPAEERRRLLEDASRQFTLLQALERRMKRKFSDGGRRAYIEATLAVHRNQKEKALQLARSFVRHQPSSPYAVPLLVLQAENVPLDLQEVSRLYVQAAAAAAAQPHPLISAGDIVIRHARVWLADGDFTRAREIAERVHQQPLRGKNLTRSMYQTLFDIATTSGDTARIEALLQEAPDHPAAFGANAYLRLANAETEYWLNENPRRSEADPNLLAERTVWRARALCDLFHTKEAFREITDVSAQLRESRADLVELLNLEKAALTLDALGDRRSAKALLDIPEVTVANRLRYRLLTLRAANRARTRREIWNYIRAMLPNLSHWEHSLAWAHWIGYGEPSIADQREFLAACDHVQPAVARFALLRAFLYAPRRQVLRRRIEGFARRIGAALKTPARTGLPEPPSGPDLMQQSLALASYHLALQDSERCRQTLERLRRECPFPNALALFRFVRVARRSHLRFDDDLLQRCRYEILEMKLRHPHFAAIWALEMAEWLNRWTHPSTNEFLAMAREFMHETGDGFEGRYAPLARVLIGSAALVTTLGEATGDAMAPLNEAAPVHVPIGTPQRLLLERRGTKVVAFDAATPHKEPYDWAHMARNFLDQDSRVSLTIPDELAGEPLEGQFGDNRPTLLHREVGDRELHRTQLSLLTAWFQVSLFDAGYPVEITSQWSADDAQQIARAAADLKLANPDWTQWEPKRALRGAHKNPPTTLMLRESLESERSRKRSYGAWGIDIGSLITPLVNLVQVDNFTNHQAFPPYSLLWISGYLESTSHGLSLIVGSGSQRAAFSPGELAEFLAPHAYEACPPLVFLDIPDDPNRVQQLDLRNRFAHLLYCLGKTRSVLAAGLVENNLPGYVDALHHCFETSASEGATARSLAPFSMAPVLYSADPTVPIL